MRNYFDTTAIGGRYAQARPYLHPEVIARISHPVGCVERAVDVGCGTGMSTVALLGMCQHITGVDPSREMLSVASRHPRISYVLGQGECLPIVDGAVSLVTAGLAYHWLDRERFLSEARRVLTGTGWFVVYNTWFAGRMEHSPAFDDWWARGYLAKYPRPPRRNQPIVEADVSIAGFELVERQAFRSATRFSMLDLIEYLTTHSNVIAAMANGEQLENVREWLLGSLRPFFGESVTPASFPFEGEIWIFRCGASPASR